MNIVVHYIQAAPSYSSNDSNNSNITYKHTNTTLSNIKDTTTTTTATSSSLIVMIIILVIIVMMC